MARIGHSIGTPARLALATFAILAFGSSALAQSSATNFVLLPSLDTDVSQASLMLDAATSGERSLIAGEQGHILYSDDDGSNWTPAEVPVSLAVTTVAYASPGNAWAAAHDGYLLQSTDDGASWQVRLTGIDVARLSADAAEKEVERLQTAVAQASAETLEDLEWALDDATFAFEDATEALEGGITTPLLDVWFEDERSGYVLGAYGVLLKTSDGGSTWSLQSNRLDNPDSYHLYSMTRNASGTLLLAGEAGTLFRSADRGQTWQRLDSPYQGSFFGAVAAADGSLLVFGLKGNVFRSVDDAATWSAVNTGDQRTLLAGMTRADGTIVLVGSAGAVLASDDNGGSFRAVPTTGNRVYSGVTGNTSGGLLLVGFGGVSSIDSNAVSGGRDE